MRCYHSVTSTPGADDNGSAFAVLLEVRRQLGAFKPTISQSRELLPYGITNAVAERGNSKVMAIKRRVGRYRNRENFKTAICFYRGGLYLYPQ